MHRLIALSLVLVLAAGCLGISQRRKPRAAKFIPEEYAAFDKPGTAAVDGQAFLRTRGGRIVTGAGRAVYCEPVTDYSEEWILRAVFAGELLEPEDPRIDKYRRSVVCDAEGRFRFDGLPAGRYFLLCAIEWEYTAHYGYYSAYPQTTGGFATCYVTLSEGQTKQVVLTSGRRSF